MPRPEQATAQGGDGEDRGQPAGTEPLAHFATAPPAEGGPPRAGEWEGYDVAILNAVLDS